MTSQKKHITLAYLNTLTFACIQMVLYTTIPYIAEKTGVVTANIIGAISVGSFIFMFMGPYWAAKSDILGRKKVLGFGMLGMAISFAFLASLFILNDYLPLWVKISFVFLSRITYGLLSSAIVPVSQAWQLDLIQEENHMKVLTKNSMYLNLGRILGPILILFKQVNLEYVIYGATIWVFALTSFNLFSKHTHTVVQRAQVDLKQVIQNWKKSFKESMAPILLALIFTGFVGILYSFLGSHIKEALHITGQEATLMYAKIILVLSILAIAFQQLSITLIKNAWKPRVIIGSIAIVVGTVIMMEANTSGKIWTSIFFISVATALIPPAYLTLTSRSEENTDKKNVFGKKLGLASVAHSLGYALGTGLIAISMKWHLVPESVMVLLISSSILILSAFMTVRIPSSTKNEFSGQA